MVYFGISTEEILALVIIFLLIAYLVICIVMELLSRKREMFDPNTIAEYLRLCSSGEKDKCKKCIYRYRGTKNCPCRDMLMHDAENLIHDQQKLIAKFGKKIMNDKEESQ